MGLGCSKDPVYVNYIQDVLLASNADGGLRRVVITPKQFWGLTLGMSAFTAGMRITTIDANSGITLKWQWSLDGSIWKTSSDVIAEKVSPDDYSGVFNTAADMMPFGRVVADVRATSGSTQKMTQVSVWGYYQYR